MTESAFNRDYLPLAPSLYRIAFYILEDQSEAEDAVQELFLKLWESGGALDHISNPKAYCIRVLRNLCLDRIRRAVHLEFPRELPDEDFAPAPDDIIDARRRLENVLEAVKSLPERQRKVLVLRTVDGLSYEEIAAQTGINYLTCRVLLSQARSKLKSKV
jgi:RNA polymerase sigma-70 factor (ECF subfamily)